MGREAGRQGVAVEEERVRGGGREEEEEVREKRYERKECGRIRERGQGTGEGRGERGRRKGDRTGAGSTQQATTRDMGSAGGRVAVRATVGWRQ